MAHSIESWIGLHPNGRESNSGHVMSFQHINSASHDANARKSLEDIGVSEHAPIGIPAASVRQAAEAFRAVRPTAKDESLRLWLAQTNLESSFGHGWGPNCWNMGAEQCPGGQPGPDYSCVDHKDSHADGSGYVAKYKCFPSQEAAARGYLGLLDANRYASAKSAAESGDALGFVKGLFSGGWFEGTGDTPEQRWGGYLSGILARLPAIDEALASRGDDPPMSGRGETEPQPVAVDGDGFDPIAWIEIDAGNGYMVQTNAEPLSRGGVPVTMSFYQEIIACVSLGAVPVTAQIEDARWRAASNLTIVPSVPSPDGAVSVTTSRGRGQAAKFAASYGPLGSVLRAGGSKVMLAENDRRKVKSDAAAMLKEHGPGSMSFYGWKANVPDGMIQKGIKSDHDREWIEYDSFAYVAKREATLNGQRVDLLTELARGCPLGGPLAPWLVRALGGVPADTHPIETFRDPKETT